MTDPQDSQDTLRGAFQACFNNAQGQIVLEYLMQENWVVVGIPQGDGLVRAECEGQRKVILGILSMLQPRGQHPGIQPEILDPETARLMGAMPASE